MSKLLIIVGPTSSGKSELAVALAKKFNGEIISGDSRQIYRGMDLGTGKVAGKWMGRFLFGRTKTSDYVYKGVVHYLIDFVNPRRQYSAAMFQTAAKKAIDDIVSRGKLPILCGGTAQWIDAVVFDQKIPDVKPNLKLRAKLEKKSANDLFRRLAKLDPARAESIDRHNKRRLIRALEIIITTGKPVPQLTTYNLQPACYKPLWIGINPPQSILYKKIDLRLNQRLKARMVKEVKELRSEGLSWKKLESFGLEYKFVSLYLQKKLSYDEMSAQLLSAIKHYSKRQMAWWKRNKNIHWMQKPSGAEKLVKNFPQQKSNTT